MAYGIDPVDGRFKDLTNVLIPAPAAAPVPVVPSAGRIMRLDDWCGTNGLVESVPADEFDPSFPRRPAPPQQVAAVTVPAPIDYSQCPRCLVRHLASRRKNDRLRAAKRARKARAKQHM